jgi:hypothetical protein
MTRSLRTVGDPMPEKPPKVDQSDFLLRIRMITADLIAGDGPYLRKPKPTDAT